MLWKDYIYTCTVLDAINLIHKSWLLTKQTTISNCYAHCGFKPTAPAPAPVPAPVPEDDMVLNFEASDDESESEDEDDHIPLSVLVNKLRRVEINMDENKLQS